MNLVINDNLITEPIENIINRLKVEANWNVFKDIQNKGNYLRVTCCYHKDGRESHPSASIFTDYSSSTVLPGTYHCFTCGSKKALYQVVADVLNISDEEGKEWLVNHYGNLYYEDDILFPSWDFDEKPKETAVLDEKILDQYKYYHPYLAQRKISFDIAKKFTIGYNQARETVTFPIWNEKNQLVMITERAINTKRFYIPEGIEKPVYLLNFILEDMKKGIKYPFVAIAEGQFDALTAWTYGIPCVATCGSLSEHQISVLKNSGITSFVTIFDNDDAGRKFTQAFNKGIGNDKFVTNITIDIPNKKDINDLTKEEFINILKNYNILV